MPWCGVCVSLTLCVCVCVRVSVTSVSCVETNKHIINFFSPSGSHTILVFPRQTGWQNSDGNPLNGGIECRWCRQKSRFRAYLALVPAVSAATNRCCKQGRRCTRRPPSRKLWHIAGSKRRCWLREKKTKCLWQEASTLRQRQQNSAFSCTQW